MHPQQRENISIPYAELSYKCGHDVSIPKTQSTIELKQFRCKNERAHQFNWQHNKKHTQFFFFFLHLRLLFLQIVVCFMHTLEAYMHSLFNIIEANAFGVCVSVCLPGLFHSKHCYVSFDNLILLYLIACNVCAYFSMNE